MQEHREQGALDEETLEGMLIYKKARPFLSAICELINSNRLEIIEKSEVGRHRDLGALNTGVESEDEILERDIVRKFLVAVCRYVLAMSDTQISQNLFQIEKREDVIQSELDGGITKPKKEKMKEILKYVNNISYKDQILIFEESISSRFAQFVAILQAGLNNPEVRLRQELLKGTTTRGTPRIRRVFRDSEEIARDPYVPMTVKVRQSFKERFNAFIQSHPELTKSESLETALDKFMNDYE